MVRKAWVGLVVMLLVGGGVRGSVATATAVGQIGRPAIVPRELIERYVDPDTGSEVRAYRETSGQFDTEVSGRGVSIGKRVGAGRSETTVRLGDDEVRLLIEPAGLTVTHVGDFTIQPLDHDSVERQRAFIVKSSTLQAARRFLASLARRDSLAGNQMFLTRALLASLAGDAGPVFEYAAWAHGIAARPHVIRVMGGGPGDCWDSYSTWAIKIWNDLTSCKAPLSWYDLTGAWACDAIYTMQAELAMAWVISCSGGVPVS